MQPLDLNIAYIGKRLRVSLDIYVGNTTPAPGGYAVESLGGTGDYYLIHSRDGFQTFWARVPIFNNGNFLAKGQKNMQRNQKKNCHFYGS